MAININLNNVQSTTEKAQPGGYPSLDGGGKIPTSQLPAIALTDVFVVNSQAAQLALVVEEGDVAVRTDLNKSYIQNGGSSGTMADWQELLTPTNTVLSVNGQTGAVNLTTTNITEGSNLYFTTARVLATALTGLVAASGTPLATDTVLEAFGKVKNFIDTLAGAVMTFTNKSIDLSTNTITGTKALFNTALSDDDFLYSSENLSTLSNTGTSRYNLSIPSLSRARVVSVTNVASLSGTTTIDGLSVAANERVLLAGQITGSENGPWIVQAGAWTRPTDFPAGGSTLAKQIVVSGGNTFGGTIWTLMGTGTFVIDTTVQVWSTADFGPWIDFSSTIAPTGFTGAVTITRARYRESSLERQFDVDFSGTSNSANASFNMPMVSTYKRTFVEGIINNGIANAGRVVVVAGATGVGVTATPTGGGFTTSGSKAFFGIFNLLK